MADKNNDLSTFIALISAIIAFFSAIYACRQARLSKKTYNLQYKMYNEGKANFSIQSIEQSFLYDKKEEKSIYYFFKVTISNLSDKSTSISKIQLHLRHNTSNNYIINCKELTHLKSNLSRLDVPSNIGAHNSVSGWIIFEVDRNVFKSLDIDTHYLYVYDIHGLNSNKEEIYVREELDGYEI